MKPTIKFKNWICNIDLATYQNGRLALSLSSAINDPHKELYLGEPIANATINIPEIELEDNQLMIKDYSENEGMLKALQDAGYVDEVVNFVSNGFVQIPIVVKSDALLALEKSFREVSPKIEQKAKLK